MAKFTRPSSSPLRPATCSLLLFAFCLALMASKALLIRRKPPLPKPPSPAAPPRICDGDPYSQKRLAPAFTTSPPPTNYSRDFWGVVNFPPVPAFHINTHDPVRQDVFISGSVHGGREPWDRYIWDLLVRVLLPPSTSELVVDVGANVGYFTLMAAALGYDVVAIEPMGRNSAKLLASIARNPGFDRRVRVVSAAASFRAGDVVSLGATHATNQGNGRIGAHGEVCECWLSMVWLCLVTFEEQDHAVTVTLDDVVRQRNVALMKIDVEGHEPAVLHGARHLLCHHTVRYVVIELSSMEEGGEGCSPRRMLEFMEAVGYAISDVTPGAPRLTAAGASSFPPNVLFTLADDALRQRACGGAVD